MTILPDNSTSFDLLVFGQVTCDRLLCGGNQVVRTGGATYAASVAMRLGYTAIVYGFAGSDHFTEVEEILTERGLVFRCIQLKGGAITYEISNADELIEQSVIRHGPPIPSGETWGEIDTSCLPTVRAALLYPVSIANAATLVKQLAKNNCIIGIDLQHDVQSIDDLSEILPDVSVVFTNRTALQELLGPMDLAQSLKQLRLKAEHAVIVVKMGQMGSLLSMPDGRNVQIPAYESNFKCTVGAGDAFDAAYLLQIVAGNGIEEACHFASSVASTVIESFSKDPSETLLEPLTNRNPIGVDVWKESPCIYLAGHFHSEPLKLYIEWLAQVIEKAGFKTYVPHRDGGIVGINGVTSVAAFSADIHAMNECVGVIALLDGAYRGGTYFEIGYSFGRNTPIFVISTDTTLGVSNMVLQSATIITSDIRQLLNELLLRCGNLRQ